jgi:hypothetical protein
MTGFLRRLAIAGAVASIPLAAAAVATSAVSSAGCDPAWSRNVWTGECHPQPALPDWYVVRPAYAPPYAQQLQPRWDEGSQQWVWVRI